MALRLGELKVAEDDVQRAGADGLVHYGDESALVLEVYSTGEPGVKAIGSRSDLIADAEEHHELFRPFRAWDLGVTVFRTAW